MTSTLLDRTETLALLRERQKADLSPEARQLCESAIALLEEDSVQCRCENMKIAKQTIMYRDGDGHFLDNHNAPLAFCPWCGHPVPQPEKL